MCLRKCSTIMLILIVLLAAIPGKTLGQASARGTIVGTVTDQTGAVLPGVTITITNINTGIQQTTVTSDAGVYIVPNLSVGNYRIAAELAGFKKAVVENARLEVGATYRADITLEVGELTAEVTVEAIAPVLRTENAEVSHVIEQKRVVDLPLNGRDYQQLQLLTPGSVNTFNFQTGAGLAGGASALTINNTMIVSNGSRPGSQLFLIDGANASNQNGRATLLAPNIDEIEEFRVAGSNFSAEHGYGTNVINVSTKSGTNEFHGSLWEFHRNDVLAARSFFAPKVEDLKRNQFGVAVGGPIIKNRSFFFFSYEGQREIQGRTTIATVPTSKMRAGDLSELPEQIYDPLTSRKDARGVVHRDPFPGNIIPSNRIDPVSALFLEWIPLPNSPGIVGNFINQPKVDNDYNHWTVRIDHKLTEKDSLMGRWSYHPSNLPFGVGPYRGFSKPPYDPGTFLKTGNGTSAVTSWIHTFSPRTQMELRASFGRAFNNIANPDIIPGGTDWTDKAGIQGFGKGVSDLFPSIPGFSYSGFTGLPGGGFSLIYVSNNYEYTGNITMVRGNHSIKAGYTARFWQQNLTTSGQGSGTFSFNGTWTRNPAIAGSSGSGLADYLLGFPFVGSRYIPPGWYYQRIRNSWQYLQDDWKVTPKLTVNMGIRYEINFPTVEKYNQLASWVPNAREGKGAIVVPDEESISEKRWPLHSSLPLSLPTYRPLIIFAKDAGIPRRSLRFTSFKQFAPRLGIAWRPREDLVIRTGYGIYYNQLDGNRESEFESVPFLIREGALFNPPDDDGRPSRTIRTLLPKESRFDPNPFIFAHDPWNRGFGYTQQWNLMVQKLLPGQFSIEAGYVGTKGTALQTTRNYNAPPPGPGPIQPRRPYPEFSTVIWNEQTASSIYHAFQSKIERRFHAGFTLLGAFTWSKAIDNSSESSQGASNPFDKSFDRGPSTFDVPFSFVLSAIYDLPFFRNSASVLRQTLGGWTVAGILTLQSGFPFTPGWAGDVSNTGHGARPVRICSGEVKNPTIDRWFDTSCFVAPEPFTFGNAGRNILRGDRYENFDFAVYKSFLITERHRLQFRAEFFNAFNHPNFALPGATINVPGAGRIFGSSPGRIIQFGLKYNF